MRFYGKTCRHRVMITLHKQIQISGGGTSRTAAEIWSSPPSRAPGGGRVREGGLASRVGLRDRRPLPLERGLRFLFSPVGGKAEATASAQTQALSAVLSPC